MEEELRHIESQISFHEAGTLLESVPALRVKFNKLPNSPLELKR